MNIRAQESLWITRDGKCFSRNSCLQAIFLIREQTTELLHMNDYLLCTLLPILCGMIISLWPINYRLEKTINQTMFETIQINRDLRSMKWN